MSTDPYANLREWFKRAHVRVCDRAPGTLGPDDLGAAAGCTCPREITKEVLTAARRDAAKLHRKAEHPGTPESCQSPHDVLCKGVW